MELKVLGSGSTGNCYILQNESEALVIEAGLPFMEVKKALNFNVLKIVGVVVSHSHGDHAQYIKEYEKAGITVLKPYEEDDWAYVRQLGNFKVSPFDLVHDVLCFGFHISHSEMGNLIYVSDTEYVKYRFRYVHHMLVEVNYSDDLLDIHAENREHVLRGHMSLNTASKFISTNDNPALRNVVLIHISDKNGNPVEFQRKVQNVLKHGAEAHAASKGLEINLNLLPF